MSRRARHDSSPPITLFSFQDIMAAVTGVMILVTLLLAIEPMSDELLRERRPPAPDQAPIEPEMAIDLAERLVAELEAEIARRRDTPQIDEATIVAMEAQRAALEVVQAEAAERLRRVTAAQSAAERERASAQHAKQSAEQALTEAHERLVRETRRSRVRFLPGERYDKAPLFIEVRRDGVALGAFDEAGLLAAVGDTRVTASSSSAALSPASLAQLLGDRSPDAFQLVFIVRQDALAEFARLRDDFYERGWEVGWQLWDAGEGGFFDPPKEAAP